MMRDHLAELAGIVTGTLLAALVAVLVLRGILEVI